MGDAGVEDGGGGLGVNVEVELGGGGDVAGGRGAAHEDDLLDELRDLRGGAEGQSDIGERADSDERDLAGVRADDAGDEVDGVLFDGLDAGDGEVNTGEAVFAVGVGGGDGAADERMGGSAGDGNFGAAGDLDQTEGVGERGFERDVAGDRGDGLDVELFRVHGQQEGEGVIDSRIGVEDDALRRCRRRCGLGASEGAERREGCGKSHGTSAADKGSPAPKIFEGHRHGLVLRDPRRDI